MFDITFYAAFQMKFVLTLPFIKQVFCNSIMYSNI